MHLLRHTIKFIAVPLFIFEFSCTPRSPLTPGDAFEYLKNAVRQNDSNGFAAILSAGSIKEIKKTVGVISGLNEIQKKNIANAYNTSVTNLNNLSVRKFIEMYLGSENNPVRYIVQFNVVSINIIHRKAVIRVENGMFLQFIREGPYWKLDLTGL